MNRVQVLDCTLRDGGYCNKWRFGFDNIKRITSGLVEANVDIIECGFLTNKATYEQGVSKFTTLEELATVIPNKRYGKLFVSMVNFGEYNVADLPVYDGTSIDGIRVAFHKRDLIEALELCKEIKLKGYKVFIQPMVSLNYSDEEFLDLINQANQIEPYAFYIVDSFGVMKKKDLIRLFYMVEHNLDDAIYIGYHSHNNMQLAYSNAQSLIDIQTKRQIIIDSSIFGMGRGAGNLNTELIVEYLNDNIETNYILKPLLIVIDEVLNKFHQETYWGYSLPNYLSASHNIHPNYAGYLDDKKTLTVENMDEIFSMIEENKKSNFDKEYIEELYIRYMSTGKIYDEHFAEIKERLLGKRVLIISPGKSSEDEKEKIVSFADQEDVITISVNFDYQYYNTDFIFLSNLRRFRSLKESKRCKAIVTSNISGDGVYLQTNYANLLNDIDAVRDNAGMMVIRFLMTMGIDNIYLAGMDGYSHDVEENYVTDQIAFITRKAVLDAMNLGMSQVLKEYSKQVDITFLTEPRFLNFQIEKVH